MSRMGQNVGRTGNPPGVTVPAGRNVLPKNHIPSHTGRLMATHNAFSTNIASLTGCRSASPAGTTLCVTAGGAQRNPWNSAAATPRPVRDGISVARRDAANHVSMGGLKARRSLAQGNALWHGRRLSTPEAPTGRNPFVRMAPCRDARPCVSTFAGHSFRRVIEPVEICAVDDRAFSPYDSSNRYILKIFIHK
jgi:hypothetical protein